MKALLLVAGAIAAPAHADEWAASAVLGTYSEFNDNPRLQPAGGESVTGLVADASLSLRRSSPLSTLELEPRVVARTYTGNYALDGDDLSLAADYERRLERGKIGLTATAGREYTATSSFVATGYVEQNVPRDFRTADLDVWSDLTERFSSKLSLGYESIDFSDGEKYGLVDYDYFKAQGLLQRDISSRTRVQAVTRLAWLHVPQNGIDSRELTGGLGLAGEWTETWSYDVFVGPSFSQLEGEPWRPGSSYRASLTAAWPLTTLRLSAQRMLSPSAGRGQLESWDSLAIDVSRRLSERLSVHGLASVDLYSDAQDPRYRGGSSRNYGRVVASLTWLASDVWAINLAVTGQRQEVDAPASGSSVTLGATWSGVGRTLSR